MVGFFYSSSGKIVFALLIEIIIGYIVITPINIKKTCLEKTLTGVFYSCGSCFHHWLNDILYVLIYINSWLASGAGKDGY